MDYYVLRRRFRLRVPAFCCLHSTAPSYVADTTVYAVLLMLTVAVIRSDNTVVSLAARLAWRSRLSVFAKYFFLYPSVGLDPKFLVSGSQPSLNGSPRNLHISLVWGQA